MFSRVAWPRHCESRARTISTPAIPHLLRRTFHFRDMRCKLRAHFLGVSKIWIISRTSLYSDKLGEGMHQQIVKLIIWMFNFSSKVEILNLRKWNLYSPIMHPPICIIQSRILLFLFSSSDLPQRAIRVFHPPHKLDAKIRPRFHARPPSLCEWHTPTNHPLGDCFLYSRRSVGGIERCIIYYREWRSWM